MATTGVIWPRMWP